MPTSSPTEPRLGKGKTKEISQKTCFEIVDTDSCGRQGFSRSAHNEVIISCSQKKNRCAIKNNVKPFGHKFSYQWICVGQNDKIMWHKPLFSIVFLLLILASACNKDSVIEQPIEQRPIISFDSDNNTYTTKIGRTITITPTVLHAQDAIFAWYEDGRLVSQEHSLNFTADKTGDVYILLKVKNAYGESQDEILIQVMELAPPQISLALPEGGLKVLRGTDYELKPDIQNADLEGFKIEWIRHGEVVSQQMSYVFNEQNIGTHTILIRAENIDGKTEKEIPIEVVQTYPYKVSFEKLYYQQEKTERSTMVGRGVSLCPILEYFKHPQYAWSVDGKEVEGATHEYFVFTPASEGEFVVRVDVSEEVATQSFSRNVQQGQKMTLSAEITVHAYAPNEDGMRPKTASSSRYCNRVYEYTPAPGQFINDTRSAGFTEAITTYEAANRYAMERFEKGIGNPNSNSTFVSLGGFGGYIIVGFDHSIAKSQSGEAEFAIQGNAFDSSSEPGIVWVMQDTNQNGLPDDEWYELRGSETGKAETIQHYAVTYFRPEGRAMDIPWQDALGKSGAIKYLASFHPQDSYYPLWVTSSSYTLRGTRLEARNVVDQNGIWHNQSYDWGYADNFGNDQMENADQTTGAGQGNVFYLKNAMNADLEAVDLRYIDFIKVQVGVNAQSGPIGEISTEVFGMMDLSIQ